MPKDEAKSVRDLRSQAGALGVSLGENLLALDSGHEEGGGDEAQRVGEDRVGRSEETHETPGDTRTCGLGGGSAHLELSVRVRELLAPDERG